MDTRGPAIRWLGSTNGVSGRASLGPGLRAQFMGRADGFTFYCYQPNQPRRACPWMWVGMETPDGGQWSRKQMVGTWNPADGTILQANPDDVEVLVDGQWRPGAVHLWQPIRGDGWEAEVGVDMGSGWCDVKMRVRPDRVRRASWR